MPLVLYLKMNREILVLKRHKNSPEAETWGLIGGKIDPGEGSIEAAIREAEEEVAHSIPENDLEFIKSYNWDREDKVIIFEVFSYKVPRSEVAVVLNKDEATDYMWEKPKTLYRRKDLMVGLYPILIDYFNVK